MNTSTHLCIICSRLFFLSTVRLRDAPPLALAGHVITSNFSALPIAYAGQANRRNKCHTRLQDHQVHWHAHYRLPRYALHQNAWHVLMPGPMLCDVAMQRLHSLSMLLAYTLPRCIVAAYNIQAIPADRHGPALHATVLAMPVMTNTWAGVDVTCSGCTLTGTEGKATSSRVPLQIWVRMMLCRAPLTMHSNLLQLWSSAMAPTPACKLGLM